jgi:ATP-dependent Lhr-like helicase
VERLQTWAGLLLDRYGVVCRETVGQEPRGPAWRDIAPVLEAAELRGEVRRGYFVSGLSGVQYAWPETVSELQGLAAKVPEGPSVLLSSIDPANLYGSGAPLDVPLLEGGTARLVRLASTSLVVRAGRPVLIVEAYGKRLTGLGSASDTELMSAVSLLTGMAGPHRRVLRVETYNLAPVRGSPAAPWLREAGFVADDAGMAYYWSAI